MKTYYDCIPCFIRQSIEAVRMATDDEEIQVRVIRGVLAETARIDLQQTPPHMACYVHRQIKEILNNDDPYKEIKDRFNRAALDMYDELRSIIEASADPFDTAVRISIAGNIIDFGVRADISEEYVKETIQECMKAQIIFNTPAELHEAVDKAQKILYLGDNAGEIVFDKLLLERMPRDKITYVVKGDPVINDATLQDALAVGMNELVRVIDNGCDAPGTILELCPAGFVDEFKQADLIIAKGQGNYETLSDVTDKDIFFLLKVKCPVIAKDLGCDTGDIVVKRNHSE